MKGYDLSNFKNGKAFIHQDDSNGYDKRICINTKGQKLFELPDRDMIVNNFEDEDVAFVMNDKGRYALMNNTGEFLTDFVYDFIYSGSEEGLFEVKRNGKHGHIDLQGREIIPCLYDEGNYFSEGVAAECLNEKWGMVDYFNNTIIPFEYEGICVCQNNIIPAKKNNKWGLINKNNEILADFIYDDIDCWGIRECLVIPAMLDDKYGLIDKYGNIVEDFVYDDIQVVSDEENNTGEFLYLLKDGKKAIYSTRKQTFLTDFEYDFIGYISENRFSVCKNNKCGYVDIYGNTIVPIIYDSGSENFSFNEEVAIILQNGKYGMINLTGELVIPCIYDKLDTCSEGFIKARQNNQTGFIDKHNNIVIPFGKFECRRSFHDGLAIVWCEEYGTVYINKKGEVLKIKV